MRAADIFKNVAKIIRDVRRATGRAAIIVPSVWRGGKEISVRIKLGKNGLDAVCGGAISRKIRTVFASPDSVFVVAAPIDQTGMIAQTQCCRPRFAFQRVNKPILALGILTASHQKILRYKYAKSVTFIVKLVTLEYAAAPNSDHINAARDRHLKQAGDLFGRFG